MDIISIIICIILGILILAAIIVTAATNQTLEDIDGVKGKINKPDESDYARLSPPIANPNNK